MNKIYFILPDHIKACRFSDEIIMLDLKIDRYMIICKEESKILEFILSIPFYKDLGGRYLHQLTDSPINSTYLNKYITKLKTNHIISESNNSKIHIYDFSRNATGTTSINWFRKVQQNKKSISKKLLIDAYLSLFKTYYVLNILGFYKLILWIRKYSTKNLKTKNNDITLDMLVDALNLASKYYLVKVKCLEWAAALTILGYKYGFQLKLVVGVQNYHFAAHAWAEYKGYVVADSEDLPKNLSVILREPI